MTRSARSHAKLLVTSLHPPSLPWPQHIHMLRELTGQTQFYNAVLFMGSVAVFSLIAQRLNATR